jgi:hypothetical protein
LQSKKEPISQSPSTAFPSRHAQLQMRQHHRCSFRRNEKQISPKRRSIFPFACSHLPLPDLQGACFSQVRKFQLQDQMQSVSMQSLMEED